MITTAKVYRYLNPICHPNKKNQKSQTIDSEKRNNFFVNIGPSFAKKIEKPYDGNTSCWLFWYKAGPKRRSEVRNKATCWEKVTQTANCSATKIYKKLLHTTDQKRGRRCSSAREQRIWFNDLTTTKTSANNDLQDLTANCVSKNQRFVVTIVYKARQMDILTFRNFHLEHLFVMTPKNNHILCRDLNIDFSKNDLKKQNFLREIGSLNLYL